MIFALMLTFINLLQCATAVSETLENKAGTKCITSVKMIRDESGNPKIRLYENNQKAYSCKITLSKEMDISSVSINIKIPNGSYYGDMGNFKYLLNDKKNLIMGLPTEICDNTEVKFTILIGEDLNTCIYSVWIYKSGEFTWKSEQIECLKIQPLRLLDFGPMISVKKKR